MPRPSFGIMTAPMNVDYHDILRVWREADTIPVIEHAWLFDHLMPIGGDPDGPIFEGWTLLAALAAQTERLRLGLLVTSNRFRPPALLAKIAATVDVVSGGRLDVGIGAAATQPPIGPSRVRGPWAGVPRRGVRGRQSGRGLHRHPPSVDRRRALRLRRHLRPTRRRVRQPQAGPAAAPADRHRRQLIGAARVVAEHADVWNIPGGDITRVVERSALLDRYCREIGRDPASITRSIHLGVDSDRPASTRAAIAEAIGVGFDHVILGLSTPYPAGVATWVADELITTAT